VPSLPSQCQPDLFTQWLQHVSDVQNNKSFVSDELGLAWWMVWYQFFILIAVSISTTMGLLRQHAQVLGNFFTALFALQMVIAHDAAILNRSAPDTVRLCFCRILFSTSSNLWAHFNTVLGQTFI
jgi:hypothetical protein